MSRRHRKHRNHEDPAVHNAAPTGVDQPCEEDTSSQLAEGSKRKRGFRLPRLSKKSKPGALPGIEPHELSQLPSTPERVHITCIDYSPEQVRVMEVEDVDTFVGAHRPEWSSVRWINVDGLNDMKVIRAFAEKYRLHPLAVEDLLQIPHRPKAEAYSGHGSFQARVFVIARMLELKSGHLKSEQVSIFIGHKTVLTFQESAGDIWDPIRVRIKTSGSRIRNNDASFLAYSLLDSMVDHCFPILEYYGDRLEELEEMVLEGASREAVHEIHRLKRELLLLRRAVWPMREVINSLQREPHECLSETTRTYLRDIYDHTVQIIDMIETYREVATSLTETSMTAMSNRMNEIMKVLTVIGTIFIPLTFLAGVYGMNFHHLPELNWRWSYGMFWLICLVTAVTMLAWFKRRGWL
ncbi:MAG: magnesium/cobalt transporter CorA [Acidobacteriota bacterium]